MTVDTSPGYSRSRSHVCGELFTAGPGSTYQTPYLTQAHIGAERLVRD